MISAIIILALLGLMDLMLFVVACFELEKEREIDEERRKNERGLD